MQSCGSGAYKHDLGYKKSGASGFKGAVIKHDNETLTADKELLNAVNTVLDKVQKGENDAVTGKLISKETEARARMVKRAFTPLIKLKEGMIAAENYAEMTSKPYIEKAAKGDYVPSSGIEAMMLQNAKDSNLFKNTTTDP